MYLLVLILGPDLAGFRLARAPPNCTNRALSMLLCNPLQCRSIEHVSAHLIPCITDISMQLLIQLVERQLSLQALTEWYGCIRPWMRSCWTLEATLVNIQFSDWPNGLKGSDGLKTSMLRAPGAGLTPPGVDRENYWCTCSLGTLHSRPSQVTAMKPAAVVTPGQ